MDKTTYFFALCLGSIGFFHSTVSTSYAGQTIYQFKDDNGTTLLTNKKKAEFNLDFQNVDIIDGKLSVLKATGARSFSIAKFNANVRNFLMDSETSKNKIPFSYQDYKLTGNQLFYDAGKYYTIDLSSFGVTPQNIDLKYFKLKPKVSRAEFV